LIANLTREQWLALRTSGVGASEAAAACGESQWCSAVELWARKVGIMPDADLSEVEHVQWGNLLEPTIVRETCARMGVRLLTIHESIEALESRGLKVEGIVEGRQLFLRSAEHPWMFTTLDGIAHDPVTDTLGDIEAKSTSEFNRKDWDDGSAPDHYRIQVTHQLAVAKPLAWGVLSCLVGGNKLRTTPRIERADAPIAAVIELERDFWRRVQAKDAPAADGSASSEAAIKAMHPDDNGLSITLPEEFVGIQARIEQLKAESKQRDDERKPLEVLVKAAIGDYTFGVLPNGAGAWSLKTSERAAKMHKASKYRTLLFSEPKKAK
jgi:predicted phage-related endonuclease